MARVVRIELTENDRDCLQAIFKKDTDWRERGRAKTILLLASGRKAQEVAKQQNLCLEAVRIRHLKGLKFRMASLPDQPRCGAPSKLTDERRQLLGQWGEAEAQCSRELLTRLKKESQVRIGAATSRTELKKLGYVWKRNRYSLKKA